MSVLSIQEVEVSTTVFFESEFRCKRRRRVWFRFDRSIVAPWGKSSAKHKRLPTRMPILGPPQHLEVECDLMANRAMRSVAALVKRYMASMVGDVAVLIEKPYLQENEEPRACLGMCRFDRVDVTTCPTKQHLGDLFLDFCCFWLSLLLATCSSS